MIPDLVPGVGPTSRAAKWDGLTRRSDTPTALDTYALNGEVWRAGDYGSELLRLSGPGGVPLAWIALALPSRGRVPSSPVLRSAIDRPAFGVTLTTTIGVYVRYL